MKRIDLNYFPTWTRKTMSFTIDDGNLETDERFLSLVRPAGIKGTFNLCTPLRSNISAEEYRRFYDGYEIANHCRYHPFPFSEERRPTISPDAFDADTADRSLAYRTDEEGLYRIYSPSRVRDPWKYWIATEEKYMRLVKECEEELESVFGKGKVRDFVWPFGEQKNAELMRQLTVHGFRSVRASGALGASADFSLPQDRMRWSYNADHTSLLSTARQFASYPDDGELKLFCFGVHSIDFETAEKWEDLQAFCEEFGSRPQEFWYAAMGEIFEYEDALGQVQITETEIFNPSDIPLYIKVDGEPTLLEAHQLMAI